MRYSLILLFTLVVIGLSSASYAQKLVGGPCDYREYAGTCMVTGQGEDGKAVYTFEGEVEGERVLLAGNTSNEGLAQGSQVDCILMFIREGTCTPCLLSLGSCGKQAWDLYRGVAKAQAGGEGAPPAESAGGCALTM
jgi:hypothetical protein